MSALHADARTHEQHFTRALQENLCVAAYLHASMCCMRIREWTDYLPIFVCRISFPTWRGAVMVSILVICSWSVCSRLESPKKNTKTLNNVLLLLLILLVYDAAIVAQAPSGRRSHRCDYDHKVNLTLNANFNASCNVSIFDITSGRSSGGRTWQKTRRDRQEEVETAAAAILRLDHNGK